MAAVCARVCVEGGLGCREAALLQAAEGGYGFERVLGGGGDNGVGACGLNEERFVWPERSEL